ncbi:MAG: HAD hydrolase-like protein [Burkholderiaceae bacterium]
MAPNEVLHIGDDAHLDGLGALNAGMQFAWVRRENQPWTHAPAQPHITVQDLQALSRVLC